MTGAEFNFRITPRRNEFLTVLGLKTPFQILDYLPRRYVDFSLIDPSKDNDGERVVIKGKVVAKESLARFKKNLTRFAFTVSLDDDEYKIVVFNRDYLYNLIVLDNPVLVAGKLNYYRKEIVAEDIYVKDIDSIGIKTLYSLPRGFKDFEFAKLARYCYDQLTEERELKDIIPSYLLTKYRLCKRSEAYYYAHFPRNAEDIRQAYRYLKYEEALIYCLRMQKLRRIGLASGDSAKNYDEDFVRRFIAALPYRLTPDQKKAANEILVDLKNKRAMYRLLQGDVGSGKTIVALIAMVATVSSGYQAALMAPTDLLSRQHYATITGLLKNFQIETTLLTSSLSASEKKIALEKIKDGRAGVVVGTHALIQKGVVYRKLGLCVVDEQQRFGVAQRKLLHEKGKNADLLLMSATPIPRTLAISVFQDLDVSTLLRLPVAGRKARTRVVKGSSAKALYPRMKEVLGRDEKIYVVCPLIENEVSDTRDALEVYAELKKEFAGLCPVLLLHGRLKEEEKTAVMDEFVAAKKAILVSTTVIEVGIDVKTASMMIVYDANCFGLAQLHQLRGRIGRGGQEATCYLLTATDEKEANDRLLFLEGCDDGFEIAKYDLAARGPGELAGLAQSGGFGFRRCNIFADYRIIEVAREDARYITERPHDFRHVDIETFLADEAAKDIAIIE